MHDFSQTSLSEAQGRVPGGEPEPMSEKSIREAAAAIDVFGLNMVGCIATVLLTLWYDEF